MFEKIRTKNIFLSIALLFFLITIIVIYQSSLEYTVVIKYNNGDADDVFKVAYNDKIDISKLNLIVKYDNHSVSGYYESIPLDNNKCKENYYLRGNRCIFHEQFDFSKTKIKENKTIELIWIEN